MSTAGSLCAALAACLAVAATAGGAAQEQAPLIGFSGARNGDGHTVYTVRADGGGRRVVGSVDFYREDPRPIWSPDGRRVAFPGESGFTIAQADGTGVLARLPIRDNIERGGSWSPDGRVIVVPGESRLWLVDVATVSAQGLGTSGEQPVFSPNGKLIAFYRAGLRVMNRDGSGGHRLTTAAATDELHPASPPTWSHDSRRIAFERGGAIYVRDVRSGRTTTVSRARGRIDSAPAWSPDGRWIAFVRGTPVSTSDTRTGVSIVRPDGSGLRALTNARFAEASPTWSPDSRRLAFLGSTKKISGRGAAYVVPVAGGPLRQLFRPVCPGEAISALSWGRGGRLLYASLLQPNDKQIYAVRADGTGLRALATSCAEETDPAWSPDGRRLVYVRNDELDIMDADGSHKRRLTDGHMPDWSPDGKTIVFSRLGKLYTVPAAGGAVHSLTMTGSNTDPAWSVATGRIAFTSVGDTPLAQVWTMAPDGSDKRQVTQLGGHQPSWSPDGRRIAFVSGPNVLTIAADGTDPRALTRYDGCTEVYDPAWSTDGQTVAFAMYSHDDESGGLAFVRADGGRSPYVWGPFAGARGALYSSYISRSPDWAPDGVVRRAFSAESPERAEAPARSAGCIRF